jgi:hypothetical protein
VGSLPSRPVELHVSGGPRPPCVVRRNRGGKLMRPQVPIMKQVAPWVGKGPPVPKPQLWRPRNARSVDVVAGSVPAGGELWWSG